MNSESFFGLDPDRVPHAARLECGVCWTVYDPEIGDPNRQIPPGTPFASLPDNWLCPNCEAVRARFMILDPSGG